MSKCPVCKTEVEDIDHEIENMCEICHFLLRRGLPYKYLASTKALYKGRLLKCFGGHENLYIHGNIGTGKTWLMAALMREHIESTLVLYGEHEVKCYDESSPFVSFPELTFQIRASMDRGSSESESRIMDKYGDARALFFDDIGAEKTTDYMRSALFVLIERRNTRHNSRTIITSNLNLNQLAKQHGERIASRIAEMCRVIKVSGPDRRIKQNG